MNAASTHILLLLVLLTLGRVPLFPVEAWKTRRTRDKSPMLNQVALHTPRRPRSWDVSVKPSNPRPSSFVFLYSFSGSAFVIHGPKFSPGRDLVSLGNVRQRYRLATRNVQRWLLNVLRTNEIARIQSRVCQGITSYFPLFPPSLLGGALRCRNIR